MSIDNTTTEDFSKWFEANISATMGSDSIQWRYARMGWNAGNAAATTATAYGVSIDSVECAADVVELLNALSETVSPADRKNCKRAAEIVYRITGTHSTQITASQENI